MPPPRWPFAKAVCSTRRGRSVPMPRALSSSCARCRCLAVPRRPCRAFPCKGTGPTEPRCANPPKEHPMSQAVNHQLLLASRPQGEVTPDNFRMVEAPVPSADDLADGQVLVRHHYLSLDPYMRGRMNDSKSYAEPQPLDTVMIGGTVGEVVASKHPKFAVGDKVVGMGGWQEYSVVDATQRGLLNKVD